MKKIAIYDPYFHILGGAERYIVAIANCFSAKAEVTVFTSDPQLLRQAQVKFGQATDTIKPVPWPTKRRERAHLLSQFDVLFYVTDGSLFFSSAKKNILIVQSPSHLPAPTLTTKIKLMNWKKVICYSQFVAGYAQKSLGKKVNTLFVPIEDKNQSDNPKENMILSVGRFFTQMHNKKQLEMVHLFSELVREGLSQTSLTLVGSIDPGGESYFKEVKRAAKGLPIQLITNATYEQLQKLYTRAKIYWHGAGFGENTFEHPEKAEHFGVSTVEAMSYGTVPIVFAAGGQTEIVTNGHDGFTWKTGQELKKYTSELMSNTLLYKKLSRHAYLTSRNYTQSRFCEQLHEILEK